MQISHEIRAEVQKEGFEAMAAKFRKGGKLYMPLEITTSKDEEPSV